VLPYPSTLRRCRGTTGTQRPKGIGMFVHLQEGGRVQLTTLFTFGVSRPLLFYSKPSSVYVLQQPIASNRNRNDWKGAKSSPTKS
jgi:hypothetical protein